MKKLSEKSLPGLHVILLFIGCGIIWSCNLLLFLISDLVLDSLLSFSLMIIGIHFFLGGSGLAYVYGIFKKSKTWKIYSMVSGVIWIVFYLRYLSKLIW